MSKQKQRSEIDDKYKWNEFGNYKSHQEWEEDFMTLDGMLEPLLLSKGKFGDGVEVVVNLFIDYEKIKKKMQRLEVHALIHFNQNTKDSEAQGRDLKLKEKNTSIATKLSFIDPELLSLSEERLSEYRNSPKMQPYRRMFDEIVRYKPHTLSNEEEVILSSVGNALGSSSQTYTLLTSADIIFDDVTDENGNKIRLTNGLYSRLLYSYNRDIRKNVFETLYAKYYSLRNTICSTLDGNTKKELFFYRARKYNSCLEESLFHDNIDVSVYNSLIEAVHTALPAFHRYLALRQRELKLPVLDMYDLYVPLVPDYKLDIPYEQAVEWVLEALAPLGEEYVQTAREALTQHRWVDVYETEGKKTGAFSVPNYHGIPYILLNYNGTLNSVFTLAHELGHSMHGLLSAQAQPFRYSLWALLVTEIASTANEAFLFYYLLNKARKEGNKLFEMYLVNSRCDDFKGTLIRQVQFAEFEREYHAMAERGEPLTTDSLSALYKRINDVYYGDTAAAAAGALSDNKSGAAAAPSSSSFSSSSSSPPLAFPHTLTASPQIAWEFLRIPHFYFNFYVYKYAAAISVSDVLVGRILFGEEDGNDDEKKKTALAKYYTLLRAGCSKDPLDIIADAGVDIRTPAPFVNALAHFDKWVKELDKLLLENKKTA